MKSIYTRFLLMYLVDPLARPRTRWMKRWIDMAQQIKSRAPSSAFEFFHVFEADRLVLLYDCG
jgi:hypothetical protein